MYQDNTQKDSFHRYNGLQGSYSERAILKDTAKGALAGNYTRAALSVLVIGLVSFSVQLAVEFIGGFLLGIIVIVRTLSGTSLTPDQVAVLLSQNPSIDSYNSILFVLNYVLDQFSSIFTTVFQAGSALFCLNLACGREARISDVFYGYRNDFGKSLKLSTVFVLISQLYALPLYALNYSIRPDFDPMKILIWSAALAVGALLSILPSLWVSQSFFLLMDFPDQSAGDLIRLSVRIMKNQKSRLFMLRLSFLPLLLLNIFTFCVGNLFLVPYMNVTYALFFIRLMRERADSSSHI